MESFKIGDVVILKSGGPKMTIAKDYNNEHYNATWFINGSVKWGDFDGKTLMKVYTEGKVEIDIHSND